MYLFIFTSINNQYFQFRKKLIRFTNPFKINEEDHFKVPDISNYKYKKHTGLSSYDRSRRQKMIEKNTHLKIVQTKEGYVDSQK